MQEPQEVDAGRAGSAARPKRVLPRPLGAAFGAVHRLFEAATIMIFIAIVVVAVWQVTNRFLIGRSLSWSEEFQRYGHVWLIFFAVPIGYRRGAHIGVDFIQNALGKRRAQVLDWIIDIAWLGLGAAIVVSTWMLLGVAWRQVSPGLGITMDKIYFGLVLGGCYMGFAAIERMLQKLIGVPQP